MCENQQLKKDYNILDHKNSEIIINTDDRKNQVIH